MSHTPSIPEGSGGGTKREVLRPIPCSSQSAGEGHKAGLNKVAGRPRNCGMACESCSKFQKDKMLSIFPALVFGRRNANWEKDKMLSIFPSLVFVPCVGRGLQ